MSDVPSVWRRLRGRWLESRTAEPAPDPGPVGDRELLALPGVVDVAWCGLEAGTRFGGVDEAVDWYLDDPGADRRSPHPLFVPADDEPPGRTPLGAYLSDPRRRSHSPFPGWQVQRYVEAVPEAARHPWGPWAHLVASLGADSVLDLVGLSGPVRARWDVVEARWRRIVSTIESQRTLVPYPLTLVLEREPDVATADAELLRDGPLVSIVIATWNRRESLGVALESIVAQTWRRWEAIVVDDGSDDGTIAYLDALAESEPRLRIVRRPHEGVCRARNAGIAVASGDYLAFLDSDNRWEPWFLATMVATMERDDLGAAYGTLAIDTAVGTVYRAVEVDREMLLNQNHVDLNVLVLRRDVADDVGGFDESLRRAVDYDLVLRVVRRTHLRHVPVVGARYDDDRSRDDRISVRESVAWNDVVVNKHRIDWDRLRSAPRTAGLTSVILPVAASWPAFVAALRSVDRALGDQPWEAVIVDSTGGRAVPARAVGILATDRRVRHVPVPRQLSFALATNIGLAETSGDVVLVVEQGVVPEPEAVTALVDVVRTHGGTVLAQPVTCDRQGRIVTAGAVFGPAGPLPAAGLAGADGSVLDVHGATPVALPSADGRIFAIGAAALVGLGGLDPLFDRELELADLGLRMRGADPDGEVMLVPGARATRRHVTWVPDTDDLRSTYDNRSAPSRTAFVERYGSRVEATPDDFWSRWGFRTGGWTHRDGEEYASRVELLPTSRDRIP